MAEIFFDLQRFATVADGTVTLTNDELDFTLDGVNYVSSGTAVLKAETTKNDDDTYTATKITGIISGTVTAFPAGESTDPGINFVGSTAFDFTCTGDDEGVLNVKYRNTSINYTSGNLTYSAAGLTMTQGKIGISGTLINFLPFNVELTVPSSGATLTFDSTGSAKFNVSDTLGAKLSFDEDIAAIIAGLDKSDLVNIAASAGITITEEQAGTVLNIALPILQKGLSLDLSGTIDYNPTARSVLFEKNTTTNLYLNDRTISFTTADDAGVTFAVENSKLTITPQDGDGSLDIAIKNGDTTPFLTNVKISGGSFIFDFLNSKVSVTAGTTTTFTAPEDLVGKRSFTITADKETGFNLALDETGNKLTLTPADENPLHIKDTNGTATVFERDITLTGPVVIGMDDNTFTVKKDTALTFSGKYGDSTIATTLTATADAGITFDVDSDGVLTLTPGENDGALNITRKRNGTTIFDFDLNVSGGSISVDSTSGKFTVEEGTTLEIINNLSGSYTTMTIEGDDASCTLTPDSDGNLTFNVESGDGKVHFLHKHGDTTIFDNVLELSGKITFDAKNNTLTAADGATLSIDFGKHEFTAEVNGDANLTVNIDSGKITFTPGEGDGSIDLKLTNGDRTVFEGNVAVSGGGVAFDLSTQTLTFDAGVTATITNGDRVFVYSLPNGAEQKFVIDDAGKLNLTFEDSEPLHVKYTNGTTTVLDADITIDGKVTLDPNANSVSIAKDTTATVTYANGRTLTFTAQDDAGITASMDDAGKLRLAANEGNAVKFTDTMGDTVREMDVEFTGAIVLDATNQKIYAEKGTTLTRTMAPLDVVESITVTDDAGFFFAFDNDSGKVTITPDEGDGKLQITHTQGERTSTAELEISGGSIIFDSSNNSLTVTKDTKAAITVGDYSVVTDAASITFNVDDAGKFVVSSKEGDGELTFTLKKGDTVLNTGSVEFDGTIEFDPNNQTVGVTKDTSATFTLGDYKYSITANEAATINLSEKNGAIVISAPEGAGSLDIMLTKGDEIFFAGNVEYTGTFTIDPANQKISVSKDSQTKITVGDYTVVLEATDEASVGFALGDGTITLSAEEGDGKATLDLLKDGSSLLGGEVELDGEVTLDVANQKISVAKDTSLTFDRLGSATTIKALDEAGFTIDASEGKITLTPGDGDGKLITNIFDSDDTAIFGGTVEVANGSIVFDAINSAVSVTKGTTTTVTLGESSIALTANDDAGVNIGLDNGKLTITPQNGDGSIDVVYSEGGQVAFESNIEISGSSITVDALNNKVGLTKDTTITLTQPNGDSLSVKALDDAATTISAADGGVRIAPDSGDGDLQLSITRDGFTRTATLGIEGAVVYQTDGNISLEDGTTIDLVWESGYEMVLTSRGSSGTIALDAEKGLGITSNDDKLDIKLTTPAGSSSTYEGIQGTLWYSSGKVTVEKGNTLTAKMPASSFGSLDVKISAVDGNAYLIYERADITFGSDDGTAEVASKLNGAESTISATNGAITRTTTSYNFVIAEGTTVSTDLISQLFTTGAAGNYVINGHKLTTTAEGVQLTATADNMILTTGDDAVTCDGLTFTGGGNVTLTADGKHIIGGGVSIADFDAGESFVLTTAGKVTVDGKTFELTEDVASGVTVTGAQDGYIIDSYSYGTEKFSVIGDNKYGVRLDSLGMDALVGIAADTTVDATATVDGEESYTQFDIVTEEEGKFTIGEKPYTISGDSSVAIWANFDTDKDTAFGFDSLNGTVSGDFAGEETFINYSTRTSSGNYILVQNDDDFKIVAGANGNELHDISSGATLESYGGVSKVRTDTTGNFTFGASDEDDSIAVTVVGDDNVVFDFDSEQYITNIESVDGSLMFSAMDLEFAINGVGVTTDGEFSSVGAYNTEDRGAMLFFHDVQDGSSISTDNPANVWKQIVGENTTINGNSLVLDGDDNGIWISDKTVVDLDEGSSLTVSDAGDYTVNTTELTANSGDTFIGLENATDAYIYDENNKIITKKTSTAEIVDNFTHGFDYGTPITSQSAVKELLESGDRDQILAMYFDDTVSADFSEDDGYKNITLGGEYAQSVKFNNQGYNVAVVDENARGKKEISTGNGGDLVVIEDTKAQVSVAAGTGNDTIVSKGENVNISLSGGKNDLFTPAGNVTVAGYDAKTASGFVTSKKNIASAIEDGSIDFADGNLSLDSAKITFENTSEVVALYDRYGNKQLVGFTSQDDLLDARNYAEDIIFVGNGNSTMLGGTANDTILANSGDIVDGGAGRNLVKLPDERTPFDAGTDILLVNGDRDTVENFKAGFGNHDDRIYIDTTATPEFKFDGSNLSVTSGGNLRGILENVANNSDFVEFMAIDDDGYNTKVAVAQENAFIVVADELADLYYGKNSGVDFSNYTKMLNLDMDNDDGDGIIFYGINSVIAGSGLTTIVGTNGDDTLVAGSGGTRVWSNWGNDLMIGNNSAEKDKETEFFFLAGDGHDTIRNFEFFTTENATTADKLQLIDNPVTDAFVTDSGDVFLKLEDDDDWLAIEGAQGKMLRVNDFIAKVDDKTVVFDSEVDYFVATGEFATLQVNESAEIWLDDDEDRAFAGDFRVIDATNSNGSNTLAGNTDDNTIFGGQGDNSLWGGDGAEGDDVLYGGGGQNAFFYAIGNGSDTIRGANDGDDVVLHGISLEQIANANISADSVEIQFTDGGSVRVEGTANVTYHLGDGSKFSADHSQGEWNAK